MRSNLKLPQRVQRGYLAEPYDGIGRHVKVTLARSSTSAAYKAQIAAGDFGGGRTFPAGTPVAVFSVRGRLEVLLGNHPRELCITDNFDRFLNDPGSNIETFSRVEASTPGISEFGPPWGPNDSFAVDGDNLVWPRVGSSVAGSATGSSAVSVGYDVDTDTVIPLPIARTVEVLVRWRWIGTHPSVTHNSLLQVRLSSEYPDELELAQMGYRHDFSGTSDASDTFVQTHTGTTTGTAAVAAPLGQWMLMRLQVSDTQARMRVWVDGTEEPLTWDRTRATTFTLPFTHLTLIASRNSAIGETLELDYIAFTRGWGSSVAGTSWGTGPLGTWMPMSEFGDSDPILDEAAWVDGDYGWMMYSGKENPTQGLRLAPEPSPPHTDPGTGDGSEHWPLNLSYRVEWPSTSTGAYLQIYFGPTHHTHLDSWIGITTQWYGPDDPTELYGMEMDIGSQGWADWPLAIDEMFGNIWFHGVVAETLEEVLASGLQVKIRIDDSGVFAKSWVDGTTEPADWLLKAYWDPDYPTYSRVRDMVRVFYFEEQLGESFKMDWVKICP